jgi:hypothetical protein
VPSSNHTGLPSEVLNFNVTNNVALNPLVVNGRALARVQTLKGNAHITFISLAMASTQRVLPLRLLILRAWSTKMGTSIPKVLLKVAHLPLLKERNDAFAEPQNLWNPPVECRLGVNALCNGIFSHFQWMQLLQVLEGLPCHGAVLPLATDLPTMRAATLGGMSFHKDILVCEGNYG